MERVKHFTGRPAPEARQPPYLEAGLTALVFIFLLYVVLGGA
jgi:hypothetical protein